MIQMVGGGQKTVHKAATIEQTNEDVKLNIQ